MNPPLIVSRRARMEFDDAANWYEQQKAGLGIAFTTAVRQVLIGLPLQPDLHPKVYGDVREALVSRYPYAVYYRSQPDQITVLAIFHTSRDPAEWQERK